MLDELQRRNYTPDTIRGYIHAIREFAEYFGKSPELMGADEVREFQLYRSARRSWPSAPSRSEWARCGFFTERLCAGVISTSTTCRW
jgi:hypothetical protein